MALKQACYLTWVGCTTLKGRDSTRTFWLILCYLAKTDVATLKVRGSDRTFQLSGC